MSQHVQSPAGPAGEALGSVALFLNVIALVAFAACLGTFALDQSVAAGVAAAIAAATFVVSMVFFARDSRRFEEQAVTPDAAPAT